MNHKAMENVSLFTFILKFCILAFLFLKTPRISDAERKVVIGSQKSSCNAYNLINTVTEENWNTSI